LSIDHSKISSDSHTCDKIRTAIAGRTCSGELQLNQGKQNMTRTWKSKKDRRDAAVAFLQKTISDPDVRSAVLKDRKIAHKLLEREGNINIPDDVEVICIGPSTQERDRLVVLMLPPDGTSPEHIDPLKYWLAGWIPYEMDPATPTPHGQTQPELAEASL
jgi:hypothetical protein